LKRTEYVLAMPWQHHADWFDLVNRRVRAVAAATERVEQHLAFKLASQAPGQAAVTNRDPRRTGTGCLGWI